MEVGLASCCPVPPLWPPSQSLGCHLASEPALSMCNALPTACLAPPFYVLFSFIWFLPLHPAQVACWIVTDEGRFSKGINTRT